MTGNDNFVRVLSADKVPNIENIDLDKYSRGYTVSIGNDKLWEDKSDKADDVVETAETDEALESNDNAEDNEK